MPSKYLLDRRTCLKGLGAALALPLLESMGWADIRRQGWQAAGASRLHVHAARRDHGPVLAQIAGDLPDRAAAGPRIPAARARPVPHGQGHLRGAHRPVQRRAARARTLHLAHRHAAGREPAQPDQHRHFRRPDRGELRRRLHRTAVAGTGHDAADAQGKSGRAERGLLLALQFQFADPGPAGGNQSPRGVEPSLRQVQPARPDHVDRPTRSANAGPGPRRRKRPATPAPQDRSGKARRIPRQRALGRTPHRRHRASPERSGPGQGGRSALASATSRIPRPSRSRSPKATSAANTCR